MLTVTVEQAVPLIVAGIASVGLAVLSSACSGEQAEDVNLALVFDELLGGETTAFSEGRNSFELSARNLSNQERRTLTAPSAESLPRVGLQLAARLSPSNTPPARPIPSASPRP